MTKSKSDECGSTGVVSYWEKKCKGQRPEAQKRMVDLCHCSQCGVARNSLSVCVCVCVSSDCACVSVHRHRCTACGYECGSGSLHWRAVMSLRTSVGSHVAN